MVIPLSSAINVYIFPLRRGLLAVFAQQGVSQHHQSAQAYQTNAHLEGKSTTNRDNSDDGDKK